MVDCIFNQNLAYQGGAGMYNLQSSPIISNCTFSSNEAHGGLGGGIYNYDGSNPIISHCTIADNEAERGGGIACNEKSAPTLSHCTIRANSAYDLGGGINCESGSDPMVTNCVITNNTSKWGYGGGISCVGVSGPTITNCIVWGNVHENIALVIGSTPSITYSDVEGGFEGQGNINVEPCFVDANNNDYHLKSEGWRWDSLRQRWYYDIMTSRCIDAGNPGSPLGEEPLSVPLDPDNQWAQNLRINMGAYGGTAEASMAPYDWALLADLTNDGIVNFEDFAGQTDDWLEDESKQPGDLNRNGTVDIADLALLANDWLEKTLWFQP